MKVVEKRWGCEIWWANTRYYLGKLLVIKPNMCTSLHVHKEKDETMYVLHGGLETKGDVGNKLYAAGGVLRILPFQTHRLIAGPEGLTLIEVSTPHPEDSMRVEL